MRTLIFTMFLMFVCPGSFAQMGADSLKDFMQRQLTFPRAESAFRNKEDAVKKRLQMLGMPQRGFDVHFRAFKKEEVLEVWVKTHIQDTFIHYANWKFCSSVGFLGPKRELGDRQIPEGFYTIEAFNPLSDYHLSLKISYPNKADSIRSAGLNPGGLIFLHGGCETIGCIPISNEVIEEAYVLCTMASSGEILPTIPFHIFPVRLEVDQFKQIVSTYNDSYLSKFWGNLRTCYVYFEQYKRLPKIEIGDDGWYYFFP